jgi:hypothetical protein
MILELFRMCGIFVFHFITICDVAICDHSDRRGSDSIVVGFTTTYAINAYHR